jgi:tetratricopeptide (TPR) repeat protein
VRRARALARLAILLALLPALAASPVAATQDAVAAARTLLAAWHEDPARIDQARAWLEGAAAADPAVEALVALSRTWFLTGEFRARGDAERAEAYERGIAVARRAIAAAPRHDRAHLLLAINSGRLAELRGVMRALTLVGTIREETETVLTLNPTSVEGLIVAGGLAAEMPRFMGGDRARAEALFKRALQLDPHQTGGRLELARLYIATRRWGEAQGELQRILEEPAPTNRPRWTVRDAPRARALLGELAARGVLPGRPPQAP